MRLSSDSECASLDQTLALRSLNVLRPGLMQLSKCSFVCIFLSSDNSRQTVSNAEGNHRTIQTMLGAKKVRNFCSFPFNRRTTTYLSFINEQLTRLFYYFLNKCVNSSISCWLTADNNCLPHISAFRRSFDPVFLSSRLFRQL